MSENIIAAIAAIFISGAFAAATVTTSANTTSAIGDEFFCKHVGKFAEMIMDGRQIGIPLTSTLDIFITSDLPKEIKDIVGDMTVDAYSNVPIFETHEKKLAAIEQYKNEQYKICMEKGLHYD